MQGHRSQEEHLCRVLMANSWLCNCSDPDGHAPQPGHNGLTTRVLHACLLCPPTLPFHYHQHQYQLPSTKWPHQSGAPMGAAPPTRSQLRRQWHTQVPGQDSHAGCHQLPTRDPSTASQAASIKKLHSNLLMHPSQVTHIGACS